MSEEAPHPVVRLLYKNRHLLVLSIVVILVGGYTALQSMPRLEDPVINNRNPQILTQFPGASADRVEALVSEPIEQALQEIRGIKFIESSSSDGVSVVVIELLDTINEPENKRIFSEIRDRLGDVASRFPPGVGTPFFDDKRNAVAFTMIVSLGWPEGDPNLRVLTRTANELANRLRGVFGTELVRLFGAAEEEITVEVDPIALANLGLTYESVANALQTSDSKVPAGTLSTSEIDLSIEVTGELDSVERISEIPVVQTPEGQTVRLSDIATITRNERDPPTEVALVDGERTVLLAARIRSDRLVGEWTERAESVLEDFRSEIGGGLKIETIFLQNDYIEERLQSLGENLLLGAGVIVIVILLTMGWRSAVIVGFALPLTAALTFFILNLNGGKIHQMSIFGMIIALGLLIDNAIVVTDEVRKRKREGLSPIQAASGAVRHLTFPLLSSTLTTVLAFMPIALLAGGAGDFVGSIAISVIVAVSSSFFLSLTIIACLAASGRSGPVKRKSGIEWLRSGIGSDRLTQAASWFLKVLVRRPLLAVGLNLVIPILGFYLAGTLGSQFFPRTDRDMFEVDLWLPQGTSLNETKRFVEKIDDYLSNDAELRRSGWLVGSSFPTVYYNLIMGEDGSSHYAHGTIWTASPEASDRMVRQLQSWADKELPEIQMVARKFAQGPPADSDVEFRLSGPDIKTLRELGEEIRLLLAEHPGILHTQATMPSGQPKIWLDLNEEEMALTGLSPLQAAQQLDAQLSGLTVGTVIEEIEDIPIRIVRPIRARDSVSAASEFIFTSPQASAGEWIPARALGSVSLRPAPAGIDRRNNERVNSILGFAETGALPIDITNDVVGALEDSDFTLPPGYQLELGGESENQGDAVGNLAKFLPVIGVTLIATLILTFRSVRHAIILVIAAPLAIGYGLLATWLMGFPISFNTIIGSMGLVGLAFNDNIVVLAAITARAKEGKMGINEIVKETLDCGRHLISTTFTTIGSFIPLLLIIGGDFWPPLAIILVGGVGGATFIAFTLTPALYRWFLGCEKASENTA
ncbi:MAG: efflux RND transporter permease subunit [Verrucomicrobiota bacterium]